MSQTKFLPEDWSDEVSPAPQPNPDDFIQKTETGFQLHPVDPLDEQEAEFHIQPLEHGEIVTFLEHRHHGNFTLDIAEDGTFTVSPDVPAEANCFMSDGNLDTFSRSPKDLAKVLERGERYEIEAYFWSDKDKGIPFRFVVEGDSARFEKVTEQ